MLQARCSRLSPYVVPTIARPIRFLPTATRTQLADARLGRETRKQPNRRQRSRVESEGRDSRVATRAIRETAFLPTELRLAVSYTKGFQQISPRVYCPFRTSSACQLSSRFCAKPAISSFAHPANCLSRILAAGVPMSASAQVHFRANPKNSS